MRLKITFSFQDKLILPSSYQLAIQSMIYSLITDKEIKSFLHEVGYKLEKRIYKPFTFSWLQGKHQIREGKIIFSSPVTLHISSCWDPMIKSLCNALLTQSFFTLHHQKINIENLEMMKDPIFSESMLVRTLSPITMYSTVEIPSGRKVTHYYDIRDPEFTILIRNNLIKKARAFFNLDLSERPFSFTPHGQVHAKQQKTMRYKGTVIKAWHGVFCMQGDPQLQQIAYQTGAGGKNGQGYGMLSIIKIPSKGGDGK